jgi:hypothetical protein
METEHGWRPVLSINHLRWRDKANTLISQPRGDRADSEEVLRRIDDRYHALTIDDGVAASACAGHTLPDDIGSRTWCRHRRPAELPWGDPAGGSMRLLRGHFSTVDASYCNRICRQQPSLPAVGTMSGCTPNVALSMSLYASGLNAGE